MNHLWMIQRKNNQSGEDEIYNVDLETDIEVEPEQQITFPFEFDISKIRKEKSVQEAWKLKARTDIPFARDSLANARSKSSFLEHKFF